MKIESENKFGKDEEELPELSMVEEKEEIQEDPVEVFKKTMMAGIQQAARNTSDDEVQKTNKALASKNKPPIDYDVKEMEKLNRKNALVDLLRQRNKMHFF